MTSRATKWVARSLWVYGGVILATAAWFAVPDIVSAWHFAIGPPVQPAALVTLVGITVTVIYLVIVCWALFGIEREEREIRIEIGSNERNGCGPEDVAD